MPLKEMFDLIVIKLLTYCLATCFINIETGFVEFTYSAAIF